MKLHNPPRHFSQMPISSQANNTNETFRIILNI